MTAIAYGSLPFVRFVEVKSVSKKKENNLTVNSFYFVFCPVDCLFGSPKFIAYGVVHTDIFVHRCHCFYQ